MASRRKVSSQMHNTLSATYALFEDVVRNTYGPHCNIELDKEFILPRVVQNLRKFARSEHPKRIATWLNRKPSSVFRNATQKVYEGMLVTVPDETPDISAYNSPPMPKKKRRLSPVRDFLYATPTKSEDM